MTQIPPPSSQPIASRVEIPEKSFKQFGAAADRLLRGRHHANTQDFDESGRVI